MNAQQFQDRAVDWLRREQTFSTDVLPGHKIEDAEGRLHVKGYFARPSSAGRWGMAGLWSLSVGTMFAMMNLPAVGAGANEAIQAVGTLAQVLGAVFLIVAEVVRRKYRSSGLVELRPAAGPAPTAATVDALHQAAAGRTAWLVVEGSLPEEVRARAAERGIRCFVPQRSHFREVLPEERVAAPASSDVPALSPEVGAVA